LDGLALEPLKRERNTKMKKAFQVNFKNEKPDSFSIDLKGENAD